MGNQIRIINKTFATAGTPERLVLTTDSDKLFHTVRIQAMGGANNNTGKNTGKIFIAGDNDLDAGGAKGYQLGIPTAGAQPTELLLQSQDGTNSIDISQLWGAAGVNAEGVVILCHGR